MLASLFTVVFAAAAAYAAPAGNAVAVGPDPSQVSIRDIVYGGSGCPQGSLGSFISADRQTFVSQLLAPISVILPVNISTE